MTTLQIPQAGALYFFQDLCFRPRFRFLDLDKCQALPGPHPSENFRKQRNPGPGVSFTGARRKAAIEPGTRVKPL